MRLQAPELCGLTGNAGPEVNEFGKFFEQAYTAGSRNKHMIRNVGGQDALHTSRLIRHVLMTNVLSFFYCRCSHMQVFSDWEVACDFFLDLLVLGGRDRCSFGADNMQALSRCRGHIVHEAQIFIAATVMATASPRGRIHSYHALCRRSCYGSCVTSSSLLLCNEVLHELRASSSEQILQFRDLQ